MKIRIVFALIALLYLYFNANGQCQVENTTFTSGEKLKYVVYYNLKFIWIEIADIELTTSNIVYNGKSCLKISSTWKTRSKYNRIIKVNDSFEAIINKDTLIVYEYNENVIQDKSISHVKYIYHNNENFLYAWIKVKDKKMKFDSIPINNCTFDILSTICYARNINYSAYQPDHVISYSVILNDEINNLDILFEGREDKLTKNKKTIPCFKIRPSILETEIFKGGNDKFTAWFSCDKNQVPIMAEAELFIGSVKVVLNSYKGLKYPGKY
ncbi:MAG: DUF3108 domain-containing protein [Bacteroidales bacterium]